MQPYLFPYIGYFQLIKAADVFVIYDNIKYTKKGWINRNRILCQDKESMFTLPLKKDPDSFEISQRSVSEVFQRGRFLNDFFEAYYGAPFREETTAMLDEAISEHEQNLFAFLLKTINTICNHVGITTPIHISSELPVDHRLRGKDRVLAICDVFNASAYVNPIGGVELYDRGEFSARGFDLRFLKSRPITYQQFKSEFVPWLSIVDVLMFNGAEKVSKTLLEEFDLV